MIRVINGVECVPVPSRGCCSIRGDFQCENFGASNESCVKLKCLPETNGVGFVCFLSKSQYAEWTAQRLNSKETP